MVAIEEEVGNAWNKWRGKKFASMFDVLIRAMVKWVYMHVKMHKLYPKKKILMSIHMSVSIHIASYLFQSAEKANWQSSSSLSNQSFTSNVPSIRNVGIVCNLKEW